MVNDGQKSYRMRPTVTFVILVISIGYYVPVGAFLFEQCDAPPPCQCGLSTIDCSNKHLPAVPSFRPVARSGMLYIYLQNNNIIVLTDNSFQGLNSSKYYIDLSGNKLHDVHPTAFEGVADDVTILKLNDNQLTKLPTALTNLSSLVSLDIFNNPISIFDATVMKLIGSHLGVLNVGSETMTAWPSEFQSLTALNTLHLSNAGLTHIPTHAFLSFATTLTYLVISKSNLTRVPHAICDLKKLVDLNLVANQNLNTDMDILPNCSMPIISVQTVNIQDNELESFPDVFHIFPNMRILSVTGNPELTSMDAVTIPNDTVITALTLSANNFQSIPMEVSVLEHLHNLYLQSNNISEIQPGDMNSLHQLVRLTLNYNPLSMIGNGTFMNATSLRLLSLAGTRMVTIPEEIKHLPALRTLHLGYSVKCTCADMAWMKRWTRWTRMTITGTCAGPQPGENVKDFLLLQLQQCK